MATLDYDLFETTSPAARAFDFGSLYRTDPEYDMESFDSLLNILPVVRAEEKEGIITVSGFWARRLSSDIHKNWGSARVTNNIFLELNARSFQVYSFFALEVDYILTYLIEDATKVMTDRMTLESIRTALREKTWLAEIQTKEPRELNYKALKRLNVTPLENQSEFLEVIAERTSSYGLRGQVLASPPGTGKTLSGYMTSLALDADMTLFIVPKNSVEEVWKSTIETNFNDKPVYWTSFDGTMPTGKEEFLICHYDFLTKLERHLRIFRNKKRLCIWIDESHNFNEITAQRTQFLIDLVDEIEPYNVVWASGTPFKAMGKEVAPILRTIDPRFTEEVMRAFIGIFGATRARAVDVLAHRIGKFTYRIDKKKVVDIPLVEVENKVKIPNPERFLLDTVRGELRSFIISRVEFYTKRRDEMARTYERLVAKAMIRNSTSGRVELEQYKQFNAEMHKSFSIERDMEKLRWCKKWETENIYPFLSNEEKKEFKYVVSRHRTLLLVVRGEALGNVLGKRRIECFKEMVQYGNIEYFVQTARKKTMVFTSYVEVAKEIVRHLESKGYEVALVIGETNNEFDRIIGDFKRDPKKQVVVATYKSLSTAVPVTQASDVFLNDPPFRDYILDQTVSRALRLGQDGPVRLITSVLDTDGEENLSSRNLDIMTWSKETVNAMLGIRNDVVIEDDEHAS